MLVTPELFWIRLSEGQDKYLSKKNSILVPRRADENRGG
jgi:hypothetical protein